MQLLKSTFFYGVLFFMSWVLFAEGSKDVKPSTGSGTFVYLQHDDGDRSLDFLKSTADPDERLYVRVLNGETLYFGLNRVNTNTGGTFEDLHIFIYDPNGDSVIASYELTNSGGNAAFDAGQTGMIETDAEEDAGPEFVFGANTINSGGYDPFTFTTSTGIDQNFYI
jgi:hypothetical protein